MVIAGINHGANLGDDVLYSGTVAAAVEGRFLGLPAIAVSLAGQRRVTSTPPGQAIRTAAAAAASRSPCPRTRSSTSTCPTCRSATSGDSRRRDSAIATAPSPWSRRRIRRGARCSGSAPPAPARTPGPGTDFHAVENGRVSVTPLQIDLTRHAASRRSLAQWLRPMISEDHKQGIGMTSARTRERLVQRLGVERHHQPGRAGAHPRRAAAPVHRRGAGQPRLRRQRAADRPGPDHFAAVHRRADDAGARSRMATSRRPEKVLEVGTGCGYQTAVLVAAGRADLHHRAHRDACSGRRSSGSPRSASATSAFVTATASRAGRARRHSTAFSSPQRRPKCPQALVDQLAPGGRLDHSRRAGRQPGTRAHHADGHGNRARASMLGHVRAAASRARTEAGPSRRARPRRTGHRPGGRLAGGVRGAGRGLRLPTPDAGAGGLRRPHRRYAVFHRDALRPRLPGRGPLEPARRRLVDLPRAEAAAAARPPVAVRRRRRPAGGEAGSGEAPPVQGWQWPAAGEVVVGFRQSPGRPPAS